MNKFLYFVGASSIGLILLVATMAFIGQGDEDKNNDVIVVALKEDMVVNMITDKTIDVGDIRAWNDNEKLYVEYLPDIENGWLISETNFHIGENSGDFPVAGGQKNLVPGSFKYKRNYDPPKSSDLYEIDIGEWISGDDLLIAANAVVVNTYIDIDLFGSLLPQTASIEVMFGWGPNYIDNPSLYYFDPVSLMDADMIDDHSGWCIDIGRNIERNTPYHAEVFSSYEKLPERLDEILGNGVHDNQKSLKKINWLLNQDIVGVPYEGDGSVEGDAYTMEDLQMAIWSIIDPDDLSSLSISEDISDHFVDERVASLVSMAEGHDDFMPGEGDKIGIIFAPVENGEVIAQVFLIMIDLPIYTYNDETCWGSIWDHENEVWATRWNDDGNWASFFSYKII